MSDHQRDDLPGLSSQGDPDAQLLRALRHTVRHDAVDADAGEEERDAAENGEQPSEKPPRPHRVAAQQNLGSPGQSPQRKRRAKRT